MIPIILPSGLSKEVKTNLKKGHYTQNQVLEIYTQVQNDYSTKRLGFKRASMVMIAVGILMTILSISQMKENTIFLIIVLSTLLTIILVIVAVRYLYVERIKKQFLKYAQLGGYNLKQ